MKIAITPPLFEFLSQLAHTINEPAKGRPGTFSLPGCSDKNASRILAGKCRYLEHPTVEHMATDLAALLEGGWPPQKKQAVWRLLADWGFRMHQAGGLADRIRTLVEQLSEGVPNGGTYGELPRFGRQIYGRTNEVEQLHALWGNRNCRFVWIEADGGAGKTSVVIKWLDELSRLKAGRPRVCLFSFNDVSSGGTSASSATFLTRAVAWCGMAAEAGETVQRRAERVAASLVNENTLLVLDGIEGLQHDQDHARCGEIKDLGLRWLLEKLLMDPGSHRVLCVLTTRSEVRDLVPLLGDEQARATRIKLECLDDEAARQILVSHQLHGDKAFPEILKAMKYHALALHLLGSYLEERYRGEARAWRECMGQGWDESGNGQQQARHILHYYGNWLDRQPAKAQFLNLLAVFLDGASRKHLDALLRKPAIEGLTSALTPLSWPDRDAVVFELARSGLVQRDAEPHWQVLTLHPIIHEHFRNKLRHGRRAAWIAGNRLLAWELRRSLRGAPKVEAETLVLLASIVYQCRGGDHREALRLYEDNVIGGYRKNKTKGRSTWGDDRRFGLWGDDLQAMLAFTQNNDWRHPVADLGKDKRYFVAVQIGVRYRWLGRLSDCCEVMDGMVRWLERTEEWSLLGQAIRFLAECHLLQGQLEDAKLEAEKGVFFADKARKRASKLSQKQRDDLNLSQIGVRTILAHACHQLGQWTEAEQWFREAEKLQEPRYGSRLLSVRGLRICQFFMDRGDYDKVGDYAQAMLQDVNEEKPWHLGEVEKGIALLLAGAVAARNKRMHVATDYFQRGYAAMQSSHRVEHIVIGRLMRAEFRLDLKDHKGAGDDLRVAMAEARHDEMYRLLVDAQLLQTRLLQETGERKKARELLSEAAHRCEKMGYLRRERDLEKLRQGFV